MVAEILRSAEAQGVRLYVQDGKLRFVAKRGAMNSSLRQQLQANKVQIIEHLSAGLSASSIIRHSPKPPATASLSCAQERLWLLARLEPANAAYNMPAGFRVRGALCVSALANAFQELIQRHAVLRTTITEQEGTPTQHTRSTFDVPLVEVDCTNSKAELAELVEREALRPFDLSADLPLRVVVASLSDRDRVILVTLHHIACDGWSIARLVTELGTLYQAHVHGVRPALPDLNLQYTDYADWQRRWLAGSHAREQLEYWQRTLKDLPVLHNVPLDASRLRSKSGLGALHEQDVRGALVDGLEQLCRQTQSTLFMALHAAFVVLLGRYANETDIVVGVPVAGRVHRDLEGLIGNFVNTVVLRVDIADNPTFIEILRRSKERTLEALQRQQFPFEKLVEHLAQGRTPNANPIFQIMFALHEFDDCKLELADVEVTRMEQAPTQAKLDLELHVLRHDDGRLLFRWTYNAALFDKSTIERMAESYCGLLEQVTGNPRLYVQEASLCPDSHQAERVVLTDGPERVIPPSAAHELFEQQAHRTPNAAAVGFGGARMSYEQLDRRANQLAQRLIDAGVSRGSLVGICVRRGLHLLPGLLAIWKAGAAYVPLDPEQPRARTEQMLGDAAVPIVLAQADTLQLFEGLDIRVLQVGDDASSGSVRSPECTVSPEDVAYVLYTSGSTGQPKGTVISHRSLVNYLCHAVDHYMRGDLVGSVVSSPLSFDATVTTLLVPLLTGAQVTLLAEDDNARVLSQLAEALFDRSAPRLFKLTPAHLDVLATMPGESDANHVVVVGGEQLRAQTLAPWRDRLPKATFVNEYGPTETVVGCSVYEVHSEHLHEHPLDGPIPIGRPIQNTQLYVVNPLATSVGEAALQPLGAIGELYIGGAGVACEYLNRAQLTAERFVPDPFSTTPGARLYRTGDLVRRRSCGELEFLGRTDHQIKLRGLRLEPGEIEARLRELSAVCDAVVLDRRDADGEPYLVAYLVLSQPETPEQARLVDDCRRHLEQHVPKYMVPTVFVCLPELPLTNNGKLDREALPEPRPCDRTRSDRLAPENEREQQLCRLWSQVLGVDDLGTDEDFFLAGGHSLTATRLVALLRSRLNIDVSLRDVFDYPSVRAFAAMLAQRTELRLVPKRAIEVGSEGPLSFAQQRLWFIDQFEGGSAHYSVFGGFSLTGRLDRSALCRAVDELLERHEVLRTVFPRLRDAGSREPVQTVLREWKTPIEVRDLSRLDVDEQTRQIRTLARAEGHRQFELACEPMLRVLLLRCAERRWVMLVNVHHIACDGWSVGLLIDDFSRLYSAYAEQRDAKRPPRSLRYLEYACHQRQLLEDGVFEPGLAYWGAQLADLPPVHSLPLKSARPATQSHAGAVHHRRLSPALTSDIIELCREQNVTLFMALQTAFAVLVGRYSNVTDVVVGTAIAGRQQPGADTTVGLFVNTVVLRTDLADNPSFEALLANSKVMILDAYDHQNVPFDLLVERLRTERSLCYDPLVQVALTLQNNDTAQLALAGLTVEPLQSQETLVKFELHLDIQQVGEQLELRWLYRTDLFENAFIERMSLNFETLLQSIVATPEQRVMKLPLVHRDERKRLLESLEQPQYAIPDGCLHNYFEMQVHHQPDRIAVRHGTQEWTYDELNQHANRLAHCLVRRGVGPEHLVGLCLEPSFDTLVGILGILKAGGAYVPIDPNQPVQRINYILANAGVDVVLTRSSECARLRLQHKRAIRLDSAEYQDECASVPSTNLTRAVPRPTGENAAYVIYTSGSTGAPKGVIVEHRNVLSLLRAAREKFQLTESDVWTLFHSSAFDFSVWEIWGALFFGGTLVVLPFAVTRDPERLAHLLLAERVTVLNQTPQAFYALQEVMTQKSQEHYLRYLVFGGEVLDYSRLQPWYDCYGERTTLVNMYGITETTVHVTFAAIARADVDAANRSIGHVLSSLLGVVCNASQELQPIGAAGELLVAGGGVARGYLGQPELSAERFLSLERYGGTRFYRTGDLVRRTERGTLDYLGRIDNQIKIRGFRIEPGEIEQQLRSLEIVEDCVVSTREDLEGHKTLVAYLVVSEGAGATDDERVAACRTHLQERIPDYMMPAAFVLMPKLPTTANGKVDYRALPAPRELPSRLARDAPPRNELESKLASAWQEVLRVEHVGIDDNFFDIGGHSLATITLTNLLKHDYQIDVPVAELFRHQTIRSLSDAIRDGSLLREGLALLLNVRGEKPPLFLLPPATGVGHCFIRLSQALPHDRPHYAFMTPGQETGDELPDSIESLASHYLAFIRRHHGVLPRWYLAGYSVGGVVAYEVGRQCIAQGYPAPHLIMLDSYLPWHKPIVPLKPAQILYDVYGADASQYLTTAKHLVKAFFEYRPRPAPVSVTLFKASGSNPLIYSNRRNWQRYALNGYEVVSIPGKHRTILEPQHLPGLVRAFERCFAAHESERD